MSELARGEDQVGNVHAGGAQAGDAWADDVQARSARAGGAVVTVFSAPGCHLCHEALAELRALSAELGFELQQRDITRDETLHRAYFERIPVVSLDGEELFDYVVDEQILRERLESRT